MLPRPESCRGCALDPVATGFAPPEGPTTAPLAFLGEALGATEAATGRPFVGDAGSMLQRLFNMLGWERPAFRIFNTISCFPGDSRLDAAGIRKGYRRWYVGDMMTVTTREGVLTGTPNHPVLTTQGWIPLERLQRGDHLVRGYARQRVRGSDPDVEDRPPTFAQAFDALTQAGVSRRVVGRAPDFHGDGRDGDVDVVTPHRVLRVAALDTVLEIDEELALADADEPFAGLVGASTLPVALAHELGWLSTPTRRLVGSRYEGRTALRVQSPPARTHRLAAGAEGNVGLQEVAAEGLRTDPSTLRQRLQTFPTPVATAEILEIVRTPDYAGHVYNLQTTSEQYVVNGFIVHNCRPKNDWLDARAPYYYDAIAHCAVHREPVYQEGHQVVVALGAVAIRTALGLLHTRKVRVEDFHGSVLRDPTNRFWVVPTFHPSFLQRGAHNLIGTVLWDLQQAHRAATEGKPVDPGTLIVDPEVEYFRAWVSMVVAARQQDPFAYPISVDIETPDKAGGRDEGEITADDRSYEILRVNFACHTDEGLTVPYMGPYIDLIRILLASPGPIWLWNKEYDVPRLIQAQQLELETDPRCLDLMWLWHYLQSDVPRGLGFASPFYSTFGPWKHLADTEPAKYGAIDGIQTHRCGFGILGDLQRSGMLPGALGHVHRLHHLALKPAQQVGVKIDRDRLVAFDQVLTEKASTRLAQIQDCIPDVLKPLTPKAGLTRKPAAEILHVKASAFTRKGEARKGKPASEIKLDLYKRAVVIEQTIEKEVFVCAACGAVDVQRRHRCSDKKSTPAVSLESRAVSRWFWQEPFNPDSPPQVLAYIKFRKHTPGKAKKTHKESTDRETLERLVKTGDKFYSLLLDFRAVQKVKGTYVDGTFRRLDSDDRVHPEPTFKPSTMRLSYVNPNITNVVTRAKPGKENLAAGYRRCVVASPGCRLLEVDFSSSEAVDVGWFARSPGYIQLAKLGVHAGLASHILNRPYDPAWSTADLAAYFKAIKESKDPVIEETYDRSKRFVHGYSYGLTVAGMVLQFPEIFPTKRIAEQYEAIFRAMAPAIPAWQRSVRERAHRQHYLGGPGDHPFGYKHWFWSVFTFKKISTSQYHAILVKWRRAGEKGDPPVTEINGQYFRISLGDDGKRCVAFYPQSTTAGKLKEAMLRLFDPEQPSYIGDSFFGRTPLRAPIHDSLLLEIPDRKFDWVASIVFREMQRPLAQLPCPEDWGMGPYLMTGVSAKTGYDWASCEKMKVPGFEELGASDDPIVTAAEVGEQEDVDDFGREVA